MDEDLVEIKNKIIERRNALQEVGNRVPLSIRARQPVPLVQARQNGRSIQ